MGESVSWCKPQEVEQVTAQKVAEATLLKGQAEAQALELRAEALKKYGDKGAPGFFGPDGRQGKAYKIVGGCRERIQSKLDKGQSVYSIAKEEGVRESAIRYQIKQGYLKKSPY